MHTHNRFLPAQAVGINDCVGGLAFARRCCLPREDTVGGSKSEATGAAVQARLSAHLDFLSQHGGLTFAAGKRATRMYFKISSSM